MIKDDFIYTQLPPPANKDNYDKARKWIINFVSRNKDVVALYEYGTITALGISDLDLILVLKDEPEDLNLYTKLMFGSVPKYVSRFLDSDISKIVHQSCFRDLNILGEIKAKLLYGENIEMKQQEESERYMISICDIMDWLAERIMCLLFYEKTKKINVSNFLGFLKSFCKSVEFSNKIMGERLGVGIDYCNEVYNLRQGWFKNSQSYNFNKLNDLLYDGIKIGHKLLNLISNFLITNGYYTPTNIEQISYFNFNSEKGYVFVPDDKDKVDISLKKSSFIEVPKIWLTHMLFCAKSLGVLGERITKNLIINGRYEEGKINSKLAKLINSRMLLCGEMAEFAKKYCLDKGLYRFGHIKEIRC